MWNHYLRAVDQGFTIHYDQLDRIFDIHLRLELSHPHWHLCVLTNTLYNLKKLRHLSVRVVNLSHLSSTRMCEYTDDSFTSSFTSSLLQLYFSFTSALLGPIAYFTSVIGTHVVTLMTGLVSTVTCFSEWVL